MAEKVTNFEDDQRRLEEIIGKLEQGDLPLEEAIKLFQEGTRLSKSCSERLTAVEAEIKRLISQNDQFKLEPFGGTDA